MCRYCLCGRDLPPLSELVNKPTPPEDKAKCDCACHLKGSIVNLHHCCGDECSPCPAQPDMEEIGHEIFEYIWDIDEVSSGKAGEQAKKILDFLLANYSINKLKKGK